MKRIKHTHKNLLEREIESKKVKKERRRETRKNIEINKEMGRMLRGGSCKRAKQQQEMRGEEKRIRNKDEQSLHLI